MQEDNKTILRKANEANARGDYEEFLSFCTDDTEWIFVGEQVLNGKEEVRKYMAETYREPPKFSEKYMIAGEDYVTVLGTITLPDSNGQPVDYSYCDVWRFRNGKMAALKAFVIPNTGKADL